MKKYQYLIDALSQLVWVGQLGLDLLMPLLLCVALCWWLSTRFGIGAWVYLPGFLLGLASGFVTAAGFYRRTMAKAAGSKERSAFNHHD